MEDTVLWHQSERHIYVAGHRGFPSKYPENTLISFQAAIEAGVDMVELDIRMTSDKEMVVIHDAAVDRTCDGSGLVAEKTLKELKSLDAGIYMGEAFRGTRVPTFRETLEALQDHKMMLYNFELKEYPRDGNETRAYETADRVMELIEQFGLVERCVMNAFDATILEHIHKRWGRRARLHGYYPASFLHVTEKNCDPYAFLYCACPFEKQRVAVSYDWLWSRGVQPWAGAWVKTEDDVREAISYHTPLITCNDPAIILQFLRTMGRHP